MKIKRLELNSFRIFEQATFDFQPGMNLIVGINGIGKSSVLDALRMLLAKALPNFTAAENPPTVLFSADDFTVGRHGLTGELHFTNGNFYSVRVTQDYASRAVPQLPHSIEVEGEWHGPLDQEMRSAPEQPIAVYFSPRRSTPIYREPSKQVSTGGQAAAYAEALSDRALRVREFVEWVSVQNPRMKVDDNHVVIPGLEKVHSAVIRFLDNYTHLAAAFGNATIELLDKDKKRLDIKQLSDGERGLLSIVFDVARRLSQANPQLDDPLRDGKGVVLIDELDLHLHPSWQRTVIEKLTKTFPNCQFIATTHSPQIIGECDPAGLILLAKEDGKVVVTQGGHQGFGLDSSWILEHLMGTAPRNASVQMQINQVEDAIEEGSLQLAREHLADLRQTLHGDDGEVVRLEASINNLEALADEVDSETP